MPGTSNFSQSDYTPLCIIGIYIVRTHHVKRMSRYLPRLVEPDATDKVRKTRITAQGIKVGVHFEQFQNV